MPCSRNPHLTKNGVNSLCPPSTWRCARPGGMLKAAMRCTTIVGTLLAFLVLGAAICLVWWNPPGDDRSESARIERELESLRSENRKMRAENQYLHRLVEALKEDPAVLEKVAREDLGYIRDGEVVILVPK